MQQRRELQHRADELSGQLFSRFAEPIATIWRLGCNRQYIVCYAKVRMAIKKTPVIHQPEIGKLIRELRLLIGLTQEQFATELGVVYPTVNRWENGHSKPSPLAMQKIETLLQQMGNHGQELLSCYFPKQEQAQVKEQQGHGST